ncbi:MAG: sugar ABC transporter ATP-binding protein [Clostridia bacterium]
MTVVEHKQPNAAISVRGITKAFGSNTVLKGIDLDVSAGEVVALIGGNGAGKSTLMKIIMGIYQPDDGEILLSGKPVRLTKPSVALSQGIYLVPQEPMLFPNMTVEENVLMGFSEKYSDLHKRLVELIAHLGWKLELSRKAATLSIAEQQLVELLRGLMRNAKILILDEPTSSLTFHEVESLFQIVEDLRKKGISIIYITHRLTEVFQIADQVLIMRDGIITLSGPIGNFDRAALVQGLLPADGSCAINMHESAQPVDYVHTEPTLVIDDFSGYGFSNISLKVYPGEILGLAGVVGAGRTELATTIFGRDAVKGGHVWLDGKDITGLSTRAVLDLGLNYVAEDRFLNGIFRISDVAANTTAANLNHMSRFFLNFKAERKITAEFVEAFRTKVTSQEQSVGSLSGGNQQKVVIAKALATHPKLLILDEPTRGIDAAARCDVYAIIQQLKAQGLAILLISSDMEEIVELSDRAVTMFCGRINKEFTKESISQDGLMAAAFGVVEGSEMHA